MMKLIPYIKSEDLVRWEKVLNSVGPKISASIDAGILQKGRQIALHLRNSLNAAALAYASGDVSRCLIFYKEGVERFQLFFDAKFSDQVDRQYVYETSDEILCSALIVRSPDIYVLVKRILPFTADQDDARVQFIMLLAALLTGDLIGAETTAKSLIEKPAKSIGTHLPNAALAIARGDLSGFLAAIGDATREFDKQVSVDARGTPAAAVFIRGAALIRLYEIVNNETIPKQDLDVRLLPFDADPS